MFIEDSNIYGWNTYLVEAEHEMQDLRIKLANKDYEIARLYLKLEEYESANLYFQSVLNNFYDTSFADRARIGIVFSHILNGNHLKAKNYLNSQQNRFLDQKNYQEALVLLEDTRSGLKLKQYLRLFK